jgi:hypothetical protein
MTAKGFRRMALGLEGAVEGAHMGHPDFRAGGRIFATLKTDLQSGMVKLPLQEQARFVAEAPDAFSPETGAWGRAGCTRVVLASVEEELLGEAMTLAWRLASEHGTLKKTWPRPARRSTRPR